MRPRYSARQKVAQYFGLGVLGSGVCGALLLYRYDETFYTSLSSGLLRCFDGQTTHRLAVEALSRGLYFRCRDADQSDLAVNLWGLQFRNPVGVGAGFDKHGEAVSGLTDIGFGFVEVGSVTPKPQEGNPRQEPEVVINTNDNSEGHLAVRRRLELLRAGGFNGILGINLAPNSSSASGVADFVAGVTQFSHLADFLVINITSPSTSFYNTKEELKNLIQSVLAARRELRLVRPPPLLVKISADLASQELRDIASVVTAPDSRVDGLVISNSTASSGSCQSTSTISSLYSLTGGDLPIVIEGGVNSGDEAWQKVLAGASLVQLSTGLVLHGPPLVVRIRRDLRHLMLEAGYDNIQQAVGAGTHCKE